MRISDILSPAAVRSQAQVSSKKRLFHDLADMAAQAYGLNASVTLDALQERESLGATGVHEAIYSLLMMQHGFIAASANVTELDPEIRPEEIATSRIDNVDFDSVLSNSFGFGGTNATLVMSRFRD